MDDGHQATIDGRGDEFVYVREIRKIGDASPEELETLARFLTGLVAEEPVAPARLDELAALSGAGPELLRRAIQLYSRRRGLYQLTGRGIAFITAAAGRQPEATAWRKAEFAARVDVQVRPHAVDRAIQRRLVETRAFPVARREIKEEVTAGILASRVSVDRPRWVRLSTRRKPLQWYSQTQRYVWDEAKTRAWVVLMEGNTVVVRTGLRRSVQPG